MDNKKRHLVSIIGIVAFLSLANMAVFFYKIKPNMSGMAITDIAKIFDKFDFSLAAFIIQWVLIVIILSLSYRKFLKKSKEENIHVTYNSIKARVKKGSTDIDLLYYLLKEKKHLGINLVARIFKISRDKALEWARILENHELATIEYPAFSEPEIEIK